MDDGTGWVRTSRVGDQLIKRYPDFDVRNFGSKSLNKFLASLPELEVEERILRQRQPHPVCPRQAHPETRQESLPQRRTVKRTTRKRSKGEIILPQTAKRYVHPLAPSGRSACRRSGRELLVA